MPHKDKQKRLEYQRNRYNSREDIRFIKREYQRTNKELVNKKNQEWRRKRRIMVLDFYGGKCACCEEYRKEFLAIDHINNNGNEHRKQFKANGIVDWLIKQGLPKEGFQVLCHNCNCAKGYYGYCPHNN